MSLILFLLDAIAWVVLVATIGLSGLLFLRVVAGWLGANPFGRITFNLTRLTEPFVRPLRGQFVGRRTRFDLLPLVMGVMVLVIGLFIYGVLVRLNEVVSDILNTALRGTITPRFLLRNAVTLLGLGYLVAIFLRLFFPYLGVGYSNKGFRFVYRITEPLLRPLRRFFVSGMFDFSPLVAMLLVQLATAFLTSMIG
jgi:uncharacterized protein YggT (Ycf19 family)